VIVYEKKDIEQAS